MKKETATRAARRRREMWKFALLAPPALFWSGVFMVIAGVRPPEKLIEGVPDAAQLVIAVACPLLAVLLGLAALRRHDDASGGGGLTLSRVSFAAGLALFIFAVAAALSPA